MEQMKNECLAMYRMKGYPNHVKLELYTQTTARIYQLMEAVNGGDLFDLL
jgi:hypothetical protein